MPILLPHHPAFTDRDVAEKVVWEQLRQALPQEAGLCWSVRVNRQGREHEIDLLVLWPGVGAAAIEVKGGRVSTEGSHWYSNDGRKKHRLTTSPLVQCQGAMHAFRDRLQDLTGQPMSSRFAYLAAFPYTRVPGDWESVAASRHMILDEVDLGLRAAGRPGSPVRTPADLADRLAAAIHGAHGSQGMSASYRDTVLRHVEGGFSPEAEPAHASSAAALEAEQDHLTPKQQAILDATRSLPRIRFVGGAGSGKTWLALEKASRLCREGLRVGFFCYNMGLAHHLRRSTLAWRKQAVPAWTGEFHEYARSIGASTGTTPEDYDVHTPQRMKVVAAGLPNSEKFDALVVDESQDFPPAWWAALLQTLKDPVSGQVYAFGDDRQDVYRKGGDAAKELSFPGADPLVPIHVDDNFRNGRQIAEVFKPFTDRHFRSRIGHGMPVRRVHCASQDAVDRADSAVESLMDEGWEPGQVALLTTHHRHPEHRSQSEADKDAYWADFFAAEDVFYGHVLGFKGLERSVVVLCVDGFKDADRARDLLYVGLSRARSLLVVVGDDEDLARAGGSPFMSALGSAQGWEPAD